MRNKFIFLALIVASVFSAAGNAQCNFSVAREKMSVIRMFRQQLSKGANAS
jgi:hypothetical protein